MAVPHQSADSTEADRSGLDGKDRPAKVFDLMRALDQNRGGRDKENTQ